MQQLNFEAAFFLFYSENVATVDQNTQRHVWGNWSPNDNELSRFMKIWNLLYIFYLLT